ncbi:hypothetical protein QN277_005100 [Acacia crassicarpa]|uniref:BZIP domain-containing protein n=1 Tax=Acacia crassicarpa TaxID=499986 RepID=A0AAE1IXH3_9FABA|nr:hypothetical protein QN277_005100 [Acacia crassicarpa]
MTESQSSSSSSKRGTLVADLDFQLKRVSVQLWILGGQKEPHLVKQHGSLADFNQEFDRVTDNLKFTEDELVRVYIAGLKDEIAASLCLSRPPTTLLEARSRARDQEIVSQMESPKESTNDGSSLPWTQEVQEKALEDQEACGSSQEESFDQQETLTDGPNETVRTSGEDDSGKTQDSRAAVSPQLPPSARPIVLALPAFVPLEEDQIRRERKSQLNRESAGRSGIRKQQEHEELQNMRDRLQNMRDNLIREISTMKKSLLNLSEDCMELSCSNDAIEKEIVEKYGPDAIADLLPFKPARMSSDESPSQGSDRSQ